MFAPNKHGEVCKQGLSSRAMPGKKSRAASRAFSIPGVDVSDDDRQVVVTIKDDRESDASELDFDEEETSSFYEVLVICTIFVVVALGMWYFVGSQAPPTRARPNYLKPASKTSRSKFNKTTASKGKKLTNKKKAGKKSKVKEPEPEEFDTLTGLSPGMQNLALAGSLAIPAAGGLYYYKKRSAQKIAEASGIAGKMKAKLGKKLFYVVSLTGITAVGGWLVKRFKPEWYKAFVAKLPNLWPFTYLKGKAKKSRKSKKGKSSDDSSNAS